MYSFLFSPYFSMHMMIDAVIGSYGVALESNVLKPKIWEKMYVNDCLSKKENVQT